MNGNRVPNYKIDASELESLKSRLELCIDLANGAAKLKPNACQIANVAIFHTLRDTAMKLTQHVNQLEEQADPY